MVKKASTTKRTTSKAAKKPASRAKTSKSKVAEDFQPTRLSLAVSALAATTLVLLALVATM